MPEAVEPLHLAFPVDPNRVLRCQAGYELANPGTDLVGEVRRRRANEGIDVVAGWLGHRAEI
jgi:hypothetical protein